MNKKKSFRQYIEELERNNELVHIEKEVDYNLEMSAICRRAYDLPAPAPLFSNIRNCYPDFRVLGTPVGLSPDKEYPCKRIAMSLGLPYDTNPVKIVEEWSKLSTLKTIKPQIVSDGPCKENKVFDKDIDITKLPSPFIHEGDGGRYINTYGIFVVQSPDGAWINWAISRAMVDGPRSIAGVVIPTQDLGKIYAMWKKIGKQMPYALCLGVDPAIAMVAGYPIADKVNECDLIGGWYGEGVEVVKCETNDLYVPASTEIVIEGFASLDEMIPEGPMGEYGGYVWCTNTKKVPLFSVTAMTYRNNPIMPITVAGVPTEENHTNWGISISAAIKCSLDDTLLPVKDVFIPFESAAHWVVVTVNRNRNTDDDKLAEEIGKCVFHSKGGRYIPKVIVVDEDIDPSNIDQVIWALATRHHPEKRILLKDQYIFPLVSYLSENEKANAVSSRVIYNCLTPFHTWPQEKQPVIASFEGAYSNELKKKVIDNWENYGFKKL